MNRPSAMVASPSSFITSWLLTMSGGSWTPTSSANSGAGRLAQAWYGRHDRIGAVGEDDVVRGVPHAVDLDDPRPASRPLPRSRSMP